MEVCEENAPSTVMCIEPSGKVLGGEDLWPDFEKYNRRPPHTEICGTWIWKLVAILTASIISLFALINVLSRIVRYYRSRSYQAL